MGAQIPAWKPYQAFSVNCSFGTRLKTCFCETHGVLYIAGSLIVRTISKVSALTRRNRSSIRISALCGYPKWSSQDLSSYPSESTRNVTPSHRPILYTYQVGMRTSTSSGNVRLSVQISRTARVQEKNCSNLPGASINSTGSGSKYKRGIPG